MENEIERVKAKLLENVDDFIEEVYPIYENTPLMINSPEDPRGGIPTKEFLKEKLIKLIKGLSDEDYWGWNCYLSACLEYSYINEGETELGGGLSVSYKKSYKLDKEKK